METVNKVLNDDIQAVIGNKALFEEMRDSTVLITGATGLIGSMLVRIFHAANEAYELNIKVAAQIRNQKKAYSLFGSILDQGDIELTDRLDVTCDYVIHTLSPTTSRYFIEHPVETIEASVNSTNEILKNGVKNQANIVYLSSMEQYGRPYEDGSVMTEDQVGIIDHLSIRSCYSESKRLCECLCASYASEYGLNVKIARLAQTFGAGVPLTDNRMPMQFTRSANEKKDIVLHTYGRSLSNFVYLSDAITGILTILMKGKAGEAYNICNDKETRSVYEIAELVAKAVAEDSIKVKVEIPDHDMGYAPEVHMYLNSDKLKQLGWHPEVDMKNAYQKLADYLK